MIQWLRAVKNPRKGTFFVFGAASPPQKQKMYPFFSSFCASEASAKGGFNSNYFKPTSHLRE